MKIPPYISKKWLHQTVWPNDPNSGQKLADRTARPKNDKSRAKWSEDELKRLRAALESVPNLIDSFLKESIKREVDEYWKNQ